MEKAEKKEEGGGGGVSGTHSFRLIHTYIAPAVNSWRSESSNASLVVLNKLLFSSLKTSFKKD